MPALDPTDYYAPRSPGWARAAGQSVALRADREQAFIGFDGLKANPWRASTRASVRACVPASRGTEIRNVRQLCIVSRRGNRRPSPPAMGLDAIDPLLVGPHRVEGISDFTHVPPSSRLQGPNGATIGCRYGKPPLHLPAREIEARSRRARQGVQAAPKGGAGVTAWVEREGHLRVAIRCAACARCTLGRILSGTRRWRPFLANRSG